ncbi:MAG: hypothetical protein HY558_08050 [Euryarchaeota archaeon]|nr:hypothetical protein [Euryarchaeota archaeon]
MPPSETSELIERNLHQLTRNLDQLFFEEERVRKEVEFRERLQHLEARGEVLQNALAQVGDQVARLRETVEEVSSRTSPRDREGLRREEAELEAAIKNLQRDYRDSILSPSRYSEEVARREKRLQEVRASLAHFEALHALERGFHAVEERLQAEVLRMAEEQRRQAAEAQRFHQETQASLQRALQDALREARAHADQTAVQLQARLQALEDTQTASLEGFRELHRGLEERVAREAESTRASLEARLADVPQALREFREAIQKEDLEKFRQRIEAQVQEAAPGEQLHEIAAHLQSIREELHRLDRAGATAAHQTEEQVARLQEQLRGLSDRVEKAAQAPPPTATEEALQKVRGEVQLQGEALDRHRAEAGELASLHRGLAEKMLELQVRVDTLAKDTGEPTAKPNRPGEELKRLKEELDALGQRLQKVEEWMAGSLRGEL